MHGHVCRICGTYLNALMAIVDIFDTGNQYLLRQIQSVTGFELKDIVDHPKYMCENCLTDLRCAIKFRQRCIISQKQFAEKINVVDPDSSNEKVHTSTFQEQGSHTFDQSDDGDSDSQIEHFFVKIEEHLEDGKTTTIEERNVFLNKHEYQTNIQGLEPTTKESPVAHKCKKRKSLGPYICDECGRVINSFSNFREHKLRHTGIKRFQCSECMKKFITQKELTRHIRSHTGERPYSCIYCPSRFTDIGSRDQHERRHTNNRCYKCSQCDKRFVSSSCLSKHRQTHNNTQRIHHCAICNQWFLRLTHLQAHMRSQTHTRNATAQRNIGILHN